MGFSNLIEIIVVICPPVRLALSGTRTNKTTQLLPSKLNKIMPNRSTVKFSLTFSQDLIDPDCNTFMVRIFCCAEDGHI